jgi:hypothetical protein
MVFWAWTEMLEISVCFYSAFWVRFSLTCFGGSEPIGYL